jgi:hypothetical protein
MEPDSTRSDSPYNLIQHHPATRFHRLTVKQVRRTLSQARGADPPGHSWHHADRDRSEVPRVARRASAEFGSVLFSSRRTLAKVMKSRGAIRGATADNLRAMLSHRQPLSSQLDTMSGDIRPPPGTHRRCLLSSGSRVRILPGALIKSPAQPVYAPTCGWSSCFGVGHESEHPEHRPWRR